MVDTVDYLLKIQVFIIFGLHNLLIQNAQESINDIYVFTVTDDTISNEHLALFTDAIWVAKQVFKTLTEFIQGPCLGNQASLARSRLWDVVSRCND